MNERLAYSPDEAFKLAGIGRSKGYAEIKAGRLRAKKLGRRTLITAEDLQAWLQALPTRVEDSRKAG
jgi:excisionase family DNA binding protein